MTGAEAPSNRSLYDKTNGVPEPRVVILFSVDLAVQQEILKHSLQS